MKSKFYLKFCWLVSMGLCLVVNTAYAQRFISLENDYRIKRYKILPGDEFKIKLRNETYRFRSEVESVRRDTVVLIDRYEQRITVPLREIGVVYYPRPGSRRGLARLVGTGMVAYGLAWFGLRTINPRNDGEPIYPQAQLILHGSLIAAGGVSILLLNNRYKIGKRWKLQTLDIGLLPPRERE